MRHLIACLVLAATGSVLAGTLDRPSEIDLTYVDRQSGQLELFVILDERVNTRQSVRALYQKLDNYRRYVELGQAFKDHPGADASRKPLFVLMAPREADSADVQNLEGVQLRCKSQGYRAVVRPYDPNVKRAPRASAV